MADVSDVKAEDIKEISDSLDSLSCKLGLHSTVLQTNKTRCSAHLDPCPLLDVLERAWHLKGVGMVFFLSPFYFFSVTSKRLSRLFEGPFQHVESGRLDAFGNGVPDSNQLERILKSKEGGIHG